MPTRRWQVDQADPPDFKATNCGGLFSLGLRQAQVLLVSGNVAKCVSPLAMLALIASFVGCSEPDAKSRPTNSSRVDATQKGNDRLRDLFNVDSNTGAIESGVMPTFRQVEGIHFQRFSDAVPGRYFLPEVMGGGVGWLDFDGDGRLDIYATNGCRLWNSDPNQTKHLNRLFRNAGGTQFEDVTPDSGAGDNRYGQGCAVGDFNSDGFSDLYVTNYGRNTLLINNGDGSFNDVTIETGVGDASWGTSAVWLDANNDGMEDLYVVNYVNATRENHEVCKYGQTKGYCGPGKWKTGVDDVLYINLGDGRFRVAPKAIGADPKYTKGLAVSVCDFDDDGRPEIYVANDMVPNFLLTRTSVQQSNTGNALFRNVSEAAGCALSGDGRNEASMGIACADFDSDGRVDIFLTHYYHTKNTLYRNLGGLRFEDDSRRTRIAAVSFESLGFGTVALDYDLDGDEDLIVANGHVLGPEKKPYEMKPQLLQNDGTGRFRDVSAIAGGYFAQLCLGRGVARADFDNDGRIDVVISHLDLPMAILRNDTQSGNAYFGCTLIASNRVYPVGGRLIITAGDKQRVIPIVSGGSYLSSSDQRIVVGLGKHKGPVKVEIVWPGRQAEVHEHLASGQYWILREGQKPLVSTGL